MKSNEPARKESTNIIVKSFPQEKQVMFDIAIIDLRSCIRDAMATAIRGKNERRIFTAKSTESLEKTEFYSSPSPRQFILFCDGSLNTDSVDDELFKLRTNKPDAKIALFTDRYIYNTTPDSLNTLDGVIPSYYETEQVLACIQVIESGIKYLPVSTVTPNPGHNTENLDRFPTETAALLTPRQRQVMQYISEGRANKYIAAELSVSESTVKVHVHEAMKRLGATSRTHAAYILGHGC